MCAATSRDFNPSSLKEYRRRVHRAIALFDQWRDEPANFSPKTRATKANAKKPRNGTNGPHAMAAQVRADSSPALSEGSYQSSIPIRPNWVVTIADVPADLARTEADRLADFVRMLAM
ncbi:MAG TPA: hypothetical protein VF722_11990 [Gemmatimonadaceae bacterium]